MKTLEEEIRYCEEVAEELEKRVKPYQCESINKKLYEVNKKEWDSCLECAKEHRQLAEWLRELVHLRNITEYLRDMVTCFEFMDSMHYNEDIIEWADSELRVDMREVNADEEL